MTLTRFAAPVDLVIFDCDGVLVDSETISAAVLSEAMREAGLDIDPAAVYARFLGRSVASIVALLEADFGFADGAALLAGTRERLAARFRAELKPIPGVAEAIAGLTLPSCVASSSQLERIRLSLSVTGLFDLLAPYLFSAQMVARGKPAPDLFLHAAAQMGAAPDRCVVIEDSPAGVQAAKRAGMRVIGFTGGAHAAPAGLEKTLAACGPDAMIDDMAALCATIAALGVGDRHVSRA